MNIVNLFALHVADRGPDSKHIFYYTAEQTFAPNLALINTWLSDFTIPVMKQVQQQ